MDVFLFDVFWFDEFVIRGFTVKQANSEPALSTFGSHVFPDGTVASTSIGSVGVMDSSNNKKRPRR